MASPMPRSRPSRITWRSSSRRVPASSTVPLPATRTAAGLPRRGEGLSRPSDMHAPLDTLPETGRAAPGPLPAYRARVAAGTLRPDPAQELAAETLQDLWRRLRGYDPSPEAPEQGGFLARFFRRKPVDEAPEGTPQGLYLVGEVGRGKSMLMDLFFACADVPR